MIPKRWAFLPLLHRPLIQGSFQDPGPHPQQRAGLTELMRAGAMAVLMWSTAFKTPRERWRGQAGSGQAGPEEERWGKACRKRAGDWCEVPSRGTGEPGKDKGPHLCLSNAVCPHPLAPGPHRYQWRLHWAPQPGKALGGERGMRMEREDTTGTRDSSAFQLYAPAAASSLLPPVLLNDPPAPPRPGHRHGGGCTSSGLIRPTEVPRAQVEPQK